MATSLVRSTSFNLPPSSSSTPRSSPAPVKMVKLLGLQELQQQLQAQAEHVKMLQSSLENVQRQLLEQKRSGGRIESLVTRVGTLETRCGTHEARTLQLENDKDSAAPRSDSEPRIRELKLQVQRLEHRVQQLERQESPMHSGATARRSESAGYQTPGASTPRAATTALSSPSDFTTPLSKVPGVHEAVTNPTLPPSASASNARSLSGFGPWATKGTSRPLQSGGESVPCDSTTSTSANAFSSLVALGTNIFSSSLGTPSRCRSFPSDQQVPRFFTPGASSGGPTFGTPCSAFSQPFRPMLKPSEPQAATVEAEGVPPSSDGQTDALENAMASMPPPSGSKLIAAAVSTQISREPQAKSQEVTQGSQIRARREAGTQVATSSTSAEDADSTQWRSERVARVIRATLDHQKSLKRLRELVESNRARVTVASGSDSTGVAHSTPFDSALTTATAADVDVVMGEDVENASTAATDGLRTPPMARQDIGTEAELRTGDEGDGMPSGGDEAGTAGSSSVPAQEASCTPSPALKSRVSASCAQETPANATAEAPNSCDKPSDAPPSLPSDKASEKQTDKNPAEPSDKASCRPADGSGDSNDGFSITSVKLKPAKKRNSAPPKVKVKAEEGTEGAPAGAASVPSASTSPPEAMTATTPAHPTAPAPATASSATALPAPQAPETAAGPTSGAPASSTVNGAGAAPPAAAPQPAKDMGKTAKPSNQLPTRPQTSGAANGATAKSQATANKPNHPTNSKPNPAATSKPNQSAATSKPSQSGPISQPSSSSSRQQSSTMPPSGPASKSHASSSQAQVSPRGPSREANVHCQETARDPSSPGALMEYHGYSVSLERVTPQFAVAEFNGSRILVCLDARSEKSFICASLQRDLWQMRQAGPEHRSTFYEIHNGWSFPLTLFGTSIEIVDGLHKQVIVTPAAGRPAKAQNLIRDLVYRAPCRVEVEAIVRSEDYMAGCGLVGGVILGQDFLLRPPWRTRVRICRMVPYTLHHLYFQTKHDDWAFACFSNPDMARKFGFTSPVPARWDNQGAPSGPARGGQARRGSEAQLPSRPGSSLATASPPESRPVISVLGQGQRAEETEVIVIPPSSSSEPPSLPEATTAGPAMPAASPSNDRNTSSGAPSKSLAERLELDPRSHAMEKSYSMSSLPRPPVAAHASSHRSPPRPGGGGPQKRKFSNGPLEERISGPRAHHSRSPGVEGERRNGSPSHSPPKRPRQS